MSQNIYVFIDCFPKVKNQVVWNHYWNFIEKHLNDEFKESDYAEIHHICPKCYLDKQYWKNKDNLIRLSFINHVIAHRLLWLSFRDNKSCLAYRALTFKTKNSYRSLYYFDIRKDTEFINDYHKACATYGMLGHSMPEHSKQKMSQSRTGSKRDEKTKLKMSLARKLYWERKKDRKFHKPSWNSGLKMSKEFCDKLSKIQKGKKHKKFTDESKLHVKEKTLIAMNSEKQINIRKQIKQDYEKQKQELGKNYIKWNEFQTSWYKNA